MSERINITFEDAVLGLKKAVALKGADYVYEKVSTTGTSYGHCANWHQGEASCIVGHYVAELLGKVPEGTSTVDSETLLYENGIDASPNASLLLQCAQAAQDQGVPWGAAVEAAILNVREFGHEGP